MAADGEGAAAPVAPTKEAQTKEELRRQKLITLQKREEMKDALTAKFRERYRGASKGADEVSLSSEAIGREVGRFCGTASMTSANLRRLEKRLDNQAKGRSADADAVTEYSVSVYTTGSQGQQSNQNSTGSRSARGDGPLTRMAAKSLGTSGGAGQPDKGAEPGSLTARGTREAAYAVNSGKGMDWAVLDKYATYLHEQDAKRQRAGQVQMKSKLRQDLDRQVADAQKRKEREAGDEMKWSVIQEEEFTKHMEKEQEKAALVREKAEKEKKDRDLQLEFDRQCRDMDKEKKLQEGQVLIQKIESELEQERERLEKKKLDQIDYMRKVQEENEEKIKARREASKLDKEKDQEMMNEYLRRLEAQDEARAAALQARLDRQKALNDRMGSVLKESASKVEEETARRAEKQRAEKEAIMAQNEKARDEKKKRLQHDTQNFLIQQMEEKTKEKDAERALKVNAGQVLKEDCKEYVEAEKERSKSRRARNVSHREELEKQIAGRVPQKRHEMSESEAAMNRQLLELVSKTMSGVQEAVMEESC